jgi:(S)-sulfolactate dehydrogenase
VRIVITEFMDAPSVERLRARYEVLYDAKLVDDSPRLLREAGTADVLIVRNRTQVRGELLEALVNCKVIGRLGVGLDNIDMPACERLGLNVIPAAGANALSVAEYVIATAMALLRGAYSSTADVAAGRWPRAALSSGREIGGKVLGLVGFGAIGQLTARLARGLGMSVIAHDAVMPQDHAAFAQLGARSLSLAELLAQADVVSLHVPLVAATRGLFNAQRLAQMKRGAVLINTARGGIVDEVALAAALRSGALGGAAIDVFDAEPLPVSSHFQGCPNLILTPHVAGVSAESNERVSAMIADEVLKALA